MAKIWINWRGTGKLSAVKHDFQDRVSLELASRVAALLRVSPEPLAIARANLDRWTVRNAGAPALQRCYDEWREILRHPVEEICAFLCANTEEGQRLRQNSPFAGVIPAAEVWEIKTRLRCATTPA